MFRSNQCITVVYDLPQQSVGWETFEQICLWQLLHSEISVAPADVFLSFCAKVLSFVDVSTHHEVLTGMLHILTQAAPTPGRLIAFFFSFSSIRELSMRVATASSPPAGLPDHRFTVMGCAPSRVP